MKEKRNREREREKEGDMKTCHNVARDRRRKTRERQRERERERERERAHKREKNGHNANVPQTVLLEGGEEKKIYSDHTLWEPEEERRRDLEANNGGTGIDRD